MMARRVIAGRSGFSPKALFAAGEQGVWYDPSDFSTMFQDAAGTTPVTAVEQPVGLMLDKSKGLVLGPELVDAQSASAWDAEGSNTVVDDGSEVKVTYVSSSVGAYLAFTDAKALNTTLVVGKTYQVEFECRATGDVLVYVWTGAANAGGITVGSTKQKYSGKFVAASATAAKLAIAGMGAGEVVWVSSISVRELPGNHAFQATSANRPTLSARYNLLTKTEDFSDGVWDAGGFRTLQVSANATTAPDGTVTADKVVEAAAGAGSVAHRAIFFDNSASSKKTFSVYAKKAERKRLYLFVNGPDHGAWFDLDLGTCGAATDYSNGSMAISGPDAYGFYKCSLSPSTASGGAYVQAGVIRDSATTFDTRIGDGTSGIYIWGADLRVANDAAGQPAYQRVNTATDYDTTGFPPYLKFDGTDDSMVTNSIDFTGTDKMSVFAGVRKLSDATNARVIAELSATTASNNGSFVLQGPDAAGAATYLWINKGTLLTDAQATSRAAPITNVLTGLGDISGDSAILRINGAQAAQSTADQGTGNYGNYPLYIGARGGSSLYFNGRLYSLIVRGAQTPANLIAATERYVARKTGVVL